MKSKLLLLTFALTPLWLFGQAPNDTLDAPQGKRIPPSAGATHLLATDGDPQANNAYQQFKSLTATTAGDVLTWDGTNWSPQALPVAPGETTTTLVDNGNGTVTYTSEDGTVTTFQKGWTTAATALGVTTLTYPDGSTFALPAAPSETVTTLVDNGNGTLTYTSEDGTATTFNRGWTTAATALGITTLTYPDGSTFTFPAAPGETTTTLVDNGNGTYTYTSEDATTTVVNTTADTNPYDPTGTGLVSTTSGAAIDELSLKLRPFQVSGSPESATNGSSVPGTSVVFRTGDVILGADSRSSGNPQFEVVGSIVGGSNNHTVTDTGNNLVVGNTLTATGLQNLVGGDSNQALGNRGLIAGGLGNVAQAGARDYAIIGSQNVNYSGGIGVVHVASDRNISNTGSLFHLMTGRTNTINSGAGLGITTGVSNIENGARNILGGLSNTSSGFSSILVGNQNVNAGSNNIITGFNNNSNSTSSNILISGRDNVLQNTQSSIIAGQNHNIDGQSNSLIIGSALTATTAAGSRNLYVGNNGSISVSSNDGVLLGEGGTLNHSNAFLFSTTSGASQADDSFTAQAQGGIWMFSNAASTTGMTMAPGASSWSAVSLREKKKNIKPYDKGALDKVNNLGLYTYEYKESNVRNSGPMFDGKDGWKEVVGLSPGENLISDKDISVLALAAIQEMSKEIEDLKAQLNSKK